MWTLSPVSSPIREPCVSIPRHLIAPESEAWITRNRNRCTKDGHGLWAMVLKANGELIGDCGLVVQEVDNTDEIEIGYHLRRDHWNQGFATEAARACRDFAFAHLSANRLISPIRPENLRSRRVAEKNGMTMWKESGESRLAAPGLLDSQRPDSTPVAHSRSIHTKPFVFKVQSIFDPSMDKPAPTMRKAALLYNPDSGGSRGRPQSELQTVLKILRDAAVEADLILTDSSGHAEDEVRRAVLAGCDTIFACGGDGTIHNIIQVLATTGVALAVLPMGTANALAHDLGLPMNIVGAAKAALTAAPRRVALGGVQYQDLEGKPGTRYFIVAAGIGADAHLFYKLHSGTKHRLGMAAYYAKAWHLWFTYPMTRFQVEYTETGSGHPQSSDLTELLGIRIRHFGGVLREFAPGASLDRNDVRLILCRTASRVSYLSYVTRALLGGRWRVPGIDLAHASKTVCRYLPPASIDSTQPKIYVEADGELLGTLPAEITIVPDALTILTPGR
jgi:diacylglycerol kinase (ATP)